MNKIWDFAKKYNITDILLIFLFMLILFPIFYAKQSTYLVDYGREVYVPWQMLNGEVLYKDIFNVYGPLGYQINALAYKVFGIHLNTLYRLGFLNSFLASSFVYLISKIFLNRKISLCIAGVFITFCVYSVGVHNLVMPYSFNAVYAMTSALISIYTMLLYIKEKNRTNLVLSFLFAGFAFANKVEYIPYFGFLFILLPFLVENKKDWKSYIAPVCAFFVFPLISVIVLLFQGVSISDFLNAVSLMKKLLEAPSAKFFYYQYGLYFNPYIVLSVLKIFSKIAFMSIAFAVMFYGLNFVNYKYVNSKFIKSVLSLFILFLVLYFPIKFLPSEMHRNALCWLGIIVLLLAVGFVLYEFVKLYRTKKIEISGQNKLFLFLGISSILLSIKGLFCVMPTCYGTLTIPFLIIPFYVFFTNYACTFFKKINVEVFKKAVINLTSIGLIVFLCSNAADMILLNQRAVNTERGKIYTPYNKGQILLLEYIKKHTEENSSIVVLPEGAMINFLSERKSNNLYYYLIPVNVQVFGEEKIIENFKQNPPDYFLVIDIDYSCYNMGLFNKYAPKTYKYIEENYVPIYIINDFHEFMLYKKK